jgi:hypothetical protein
MGHRDRLAIWAVLADAAARSPWVGYGWNQVAHAQLIAAADHPAVGELFGNSHNIVLDLVLWMGIPLGLLVTLLVVLWFIGIARRCKNGNDWTLMIAIAAISVHAMLEYPLDYSYFLVPLGLLMGTVHGHGEERPAGLQAQWLAAPVTALAGMLIWIGVEYIRVEEAARQLRFVLAGVGVDKVPYVAPPEVRLLDGPREFHRFWNTPARAAMPAADVDWMRDVVERNPERQAMLRYALAAGLNGRAADAASTLTALCKLRSSRLCSQSRQFWAEAQSLNPQLRNIPFP